MSVTPNSGLQLKSNSTGISRSLLTSYRRVGLSRKVKTPSERSECLSTEKTPIHKSSPSLISAETAESNETPVLRRDSSNKISKTLLTPCRRIGLSRKPKNPVSSKETAYPEISIDGICDNSNQQITPTRHKFLQSKDTFDETFVSRKQSSPITTDTDNARKMCVDSNRTECHELESKTELVIKKRTISRSSSSELFDSNDSSPVPFNKMKQKAKGTPAKPISKRVKRFNTENYLSTDLNQTPPNKNTLLDHTEIINVEYSTQENILKPLLDPKWLMIPLAKPALPECESATKTKLCKRSLSLKKSDVNTSSEEEVINPVKLGRKLKQSRLNTSSGEEVICVVKPSKKLREVEIKLNRLSKEEIKLKTSSNTDYIDPFDTAQESIALINTSCDGVASHFNFKTTDDDDDAFTSTPDTDKNKNVLIEKITKMEIENKQNQDTLEKLKQASIYRQKHNPDELQKLTQLWKDGCISALSDLLKALKTHGMGDLNSVLVKLKVPCDIIAKLPTDIWNN